MLALYITPANTDDRAAVSTLADAVQEAIGNSVNLVCVDKGNKGERAAKAAVDHGIAQEVAKLHEAKLLRLATTQMFRRARLRSGGPFLPTVSRL